MPLTVHGPMLAFSKQILRRFKIGTSVGPASPNTNSIMQGCPLAILRINAVIAAWARSMSNHPSTSLCPIAAYIDDKNARAHSLEQLQQVIQATSDFDEATDAVINSDKTVAFATSHTGRKQIQNLTVDGQVLRSTHHDKLLGGHISFTKKRSRDLANKRAQKYIEVAETVAICTLSIAAKETMLITAGAAKYKYGLEIGPCIKSVESRLRNRILQAIWRGRAVKSADIVLTLCHRGYLFDPMQMRVISPFIIARGQMKKNPHVQQMWLHIWHGTSTARSNFRDGRTNSVG